MKSLSEANLVSNLETVCASSDPVNPSGKLSVPEVADPVMEYFLVAQTQFMNAMMQNMNNMMTQQNQTTATLVNLMNQNNQANRRPVASVSTRADDNQQLSSAPVVMHPDLSQFPATQNQLMSATMQPSDSSNLCNDAQLVAIPTARPQTKFAKFMMIEPPVFEGSTALKDAESWIRTIEKIFEPQSEH